MIPMICLNKRSVITEFTSDMNPFSALLGEVLHTAYVSSPYETSQLNREMCLSDIDSHVTDYIDRLYAYSREITTPDPCHTFEVTNSLQRLLHIIGEFEYNLDEQDANYEYEVPLLAMASWLYTRSLMAFSDAWLHTLLHAVADRYMTLIRIPTTCQFEAIEAIRSMVQTHQTYKFTEVIAILEGSTPGMDKVLAAVAITCDDLL